MLGDVTNWSLQYSPSSQRRREVRPGCGDPLFFTLHERRITKYTGFGASRNLYRLNVGGIFPVFITLLVTRVLTKSVGQARLARVLTFPQECRAGGRGMKGHAGAAHGHLTRGMARWDTCPFARIGAWR